MFDRMPNLSEQLCPSTSCNAVPSIDDKWNRNLKEDLQTAVGLVCELKEKLEKLHPRCADIVAGWLRS
jgi:hypothetical protein